MTAEFRQEDEFVGAWGGHDHADAVMSSTRCYECQGYGHIARGGEERQKGRKVSQALRRTAGREKRRARVRAKERTEKEEARRVLKGTLQGKEKEASKDIVITVGVLGIPPESARR